ncbi:hypothetical protein M5689_000155 [Euphorbia peplus]|nr:hypothetical protein M5689_000155 [Euphorbia peplus]
MIASYLVKETLAAVSLSAATIALDGDIMSLMSIDAVRDLKAKIYRLVSRISFSEIHSMYLTISILTFPLVFIYDAGRASKNNPLDVFLQFRGSLHHARSNPKEKATAALFHNISIYISSVDGPQIHSSSLKFIQRVKKSTISKLSLTVAKDDTEG